MTKSEFQGQFARLCKGFRFDATDEQIDAWYRKVQAYSLGEWTEVVSTCLCAPRFPSVEPTLAALERVQRERKQALAWKQRRDDERLSTRVDSGGGSGLSPELWAAIRAVSGREQIRHYQRIVALNARDRWTPASRTAELTRLREAEQRCTAELARLLPTFDEADLAVFMARYREQVAA